MFRESLARHTCAPAAHSFEYACVHVDGEPLKGMEEKFVIYSWSCWRKRRFVPHGVQPMGD